MSEMTKLKAHMFLLMRERMSREYLRQKIGKKADEENLWKYSAKRQMMTQPERKMVK